MKLSKLGVNIRVLILVVSELITYSLLIFKEISGKQVLEPKAHDLFL